jgi:MinD-like ATPase involved in chromosome partitioning or flagellar assembly
MGKIIGIISIKGGVGKTSVVSALGAALANEFDKKVLLVDANFSAPNLALHFGVVDPEFTLHDVLINNTKIKDAIYESDHKFHVIPGALVSNYEGKIDIFKLKQVLSSIKNDYDLILIDSSPSMSGELLATMIASDELIVITTPDIVTLASTLHAVKKAKEKKTPIIGLILNRVYNKKFELTIHEIEEASEVPVLAVLPHDINFLEALSKNKPITLYKETEAANELKKLAASLIGMDYGKISLWKRLFGKIPKQEVNRTVLKTSKNK